MEWSSQWLPLIFPILLLQVGLMVVALVDLIRRERTRGPKLVWVPVILFISFIGPITYLVFGRGE